jgi:hypothetical protein
LAKRGFVAGELELGWTEWRDAGLPMHRARVPRGEIRCSCSRW